MGSGRILRAVIAAVELPENNLVQWNRRFGERKRVHVRMVDALENRARRREFEQVLFGLYRRRLANRRTFAHLAFLCGRRYELIAYLFFLADPEYYMPIKTTWFDRVFEAMGLGLRTARQCSWGNYCDFMAVMAEVRSRLAMRMGVSVSLLDAHSFCWLLATYGRETMRHAARGRGRRHRMPPALRLFSGALVPRDGISLVNESAPLVDSVVDMPAIVALRTAAGRNAEAIAVEEERQRLLEAGRPDLSDAIRDVSDRPSLGYDIHSYEVDGSIRHIEVKNVGRGSRFFISSNEWRASRQRPNSWFYLVVQGTGARHRIEMLEASDVSECHLVPTQFAIRIRR